MTTFSVELPALTARRFDRLALSSGGRAALLRQLINACAVDLEDGVYGARRSVMLKVRLSAADVACLAAVSHAMGMPPATWIAALVRRWLRARPALAPNDERQLLAIRTELDRIRLALNHIARVTGEAIATGRPPILDLDAIEAFRVEVRDQVQALRSAFQGNISYWDVTP
jgi:hypothetical protein